MNTKLPFGSGSPVGSSRPKADLGRQIRRNTARRTTPRSSGRPPRGRSTPRLRRCYRRTFQLPSSDPRKLHSRGHLLDRIVLGVQDQPISREAHSAHCLGKAQLIKPAKGHVVDRGIGIAAHAYPRGRQLWRARRPHVPGDERTRPCPCNRRRRHYRIGVADHSALSRCPLWALPVLVR